MPVFILRLRLVFGRRSGNSQGTVGSHVIDSQSHGRRLMSTDPNEPDVGHSSGLFPLILAVLISAILLVFVMSTTRQHASTTDEGAVPASTAPAQPAPTP